MPIRAHRTHRLGDNPDQRVIDSAQIVVAAQTSCLGGLDIAAHRFAVQTAMRGDRPVPGAGRPATPSQTRSTSLISFTLTSRKAMPATSVTCAVTAIERTNEKTTDATRRWSHNWQSRWPHHPGKNQVTLVPSSWQATPFLPDVVREWRDSHPGEAVPDGLVLTQPWSATSAEKTRGIPDRVIYYQFRADRARRTLRGIDEQVRKAERAVDGHAPVKRNRYIQLAGATKSVNRTLEAKTRALAGWKGYTTNLTSASSTFVIDAYHQLWHIEKSFRMSKHDLQARPIYHHLRDSIEAHLSIVVAAMAVSHHIETQTGWSIKKFVRTARRYRTVKIQAGTQTLTAADPLPDDLRSALLKNRSDGAH